MTLPAGQHPIDGFPRFGTHLHRPPPAVPIDTVIVNGPYASAVSKNVTPRSTADRRSAIISFLSAAGP
jgi:hypothetical protein